MGEGVDTVVTHGYYGRDRCVNYKDVRNIKTIIERKNRLLGRKYHVPTDDSVCDDCDKALWVDPDFRPCFGEK